MGIGRTSPLKKKLFHNLDKMPLVLHYSTRDRAAYYVEQNMDCEVMYMHLQRITYENYLTYRDIILGYRKIYVVGSVNFDYSEVYEDLKNSTTLIRLDDPNTSYRWEISKYRTIIDEALILLGRCKLPNYDWKRFQKIVIEQIGHVIKNDITEDIVKHKKELELWHTAISNNFESLDTYSLQYRRNFEGIVYKHVPDNNTCICDNRKAPVDVVCKKCKKTYGKRVLSKLSSCTLDKNRPDLRCFYCRWENINW